MIIKSVKPDSFGKLKLKNAISLINGLNLIYGPNEAGKSTIQNFIKVMLFGMQSRRGRARYTHERDSLIPWDSDNAMGHLVVETNEGKQFRIQRTFSRNSYKADTLDVFDERTGSEVKISDEPGIEFMGISRETFENTLFVRQLASSSIDDDNKQIYSRIVNLRQTGNENIQAGKAKNVLSDKITELQSRKRNVSIDFVNKQIEDISNELDELYSLHAKMMDYEKELNDFRIHANLLEDNLRILEKKHRKADYWRKRRIYENASGYIAEKLVVEQKIAELEKFKEFAEVDFEKYSEYKSQRDTLLKFLEDRLKEVRLLQQDIEGLKYSDKDLKITAEQVENLREMKLEYKALLEQYNESNKKLITLKVKLSEAQEAIGGFEGLKESDRDIDIVVKDKLDEIAGIEKAIEECSDNINRHNKLKAELAEKQSKIRDLVDELGYDTMPDISEDDLQKEELISDEIAKLGNNEWLIRKTIQQETMEKRKVEVGEGAKQPKYLMIFGAASFFIGILASLWLLPFIGLGFVGLGVYLLGLFKARRLQENLNNLDADIKRIDEEIHDYKNKEVYNKEWIEEFYKKLGVTDRQQFIKKRKQFENYFNESQRLKPIIKELHNDLLLIDIDKETNLLEHLTTTKQELQSFVDDIYDKFKCDNFYSFSQKLRDFVVVHTNYVATKESYDNMLETVANCNAKIQEIQQKIRFIFKDNELKNDNSVIFAIDELITEFDKNKNLKSLLSINEQRFSEADKKNKELMEQVEQFNIKIKDIITQFSVESEEDFEQAVQYANEFLLYSKRSEQLEQLISGTLGEYDIKQLENECNDSECDYSEDIVEEISYQINLERNALQSVRENIVRLETRINSFVTLERIPLLESDLNELKQAKKAMEASLETFQIASRVLDECLDEMVNDFGIILNQKTQNIIMKLTDSRYNQVKINEDDFSMRAYEPDANRFVNVDLLSNGTIDQLYFAMRLATTEMIEDNVRLPIILDDAFIQYDDNRLAKTLEYLLEHSKTRQIILFTCQKREAKVLSQLKAKGKYNYFDLSAAV